MPAWGIQIIKINVKGDHCMSQFAKPTGFFGKMLAKGMAWGHKDFYKNTAKALDLKHNDKYLEIGFGAGLFIKRYVSHVSRIAGLDYSEDMVKLASEINKKLVESGKAEFKQGNASILPWNNNEFSVVVAIETFFFWPEPKTSLKEIFRILMPSGRLVIEMAYNTDDGLDHTKHIKDMNLKLYSSEEMKVLLKQSGFSDIAVEYYKGFWIPVKGHVVPKGMIVKAIKK
jgi:ubiquinone/menaquinone biosynthesis C-methylase UbiE